MSDASTSKKDLIFVNINIPLHAVLMESKQGLLVQYADKAVWVSKQYIKKFNELTDIYSVGIVKSWEYKIYHTKDLIRNTQENKTYIEQYKILGTQLSEHLLDYFQLNNLSGNQWK